MMNVEGKAAIVTGAATGIGRATAIALGARGCSVLVNYRESKADAESAVEHVRLMGVRSIAYQADVSNDSSCRDMIAAAVREFGRLDVLVQSAGTTAFTDPRDLYAITDEEWDRILGVNLKGPFQCARAARSAMERSGGGAIVNVSSLAASRALDTAIPYSASKAALNSLTLALSRALAPTIRVNAVAPGFIGGRRLAEGLGSAYEGVRRAVERRTPLAAVGQPIDVAAAIMSLITGSDFVTGQILTVDGGMSNLV